MTMQRMKGRPGLRSSNLPSKQHDNIEECFVAYDYDATARQLTYTTHPSGQSETYALLQLLSENPAEEEANTKVYSVPRHRYQIGKSSLKTRKRVWKDEQDDLNRVLDEERQAWSKRSHRDLREQYNIGEAERQLAESCEEADTCGTSMKEETSIYDRPRRRSNFAEGSMTEGSRGTASTWQGSSLESPSTPKPAMEEDSDLDATPRPCDTDQASARSSFDINDFKPLPPTPSTLASTLKRFRQQFKTVDKKHNSPQISTSDMKTLRNPRKGLRKSLSSWKIFNSSASETSDIESDNVEDFKPGSTVRRKDNHSNYQQSILDERKRKAEIAYAEQFGTSKKRKKDNSEQGRVLRDQTCSDTEQVTIRKRSGVSMSNLEAVSSMVRSDKTDVDAGSLHPHSDEFSRQNCTQDQRESISHVPSLPRVSSLNFESDIDRRKRRRRSYSALEKENQYLRQQLKASECRESTRRASNIAQTSSDNKTSNSMLSSSTASDKAKGDVEGQLQNAEGHCTPASDNHKQSTEPRSVPNTPSSQSKAAPKSRGIEASELSQIIQETLPAPSAARISSSQSTLSPLSLNVNYSRGSATVRHRPLCSSTKQNSTLGIPRSLSMVLEGIEEDENGETGENIDTSTVTKVGITGRRMLGQIAESEPRKKEGKWEWPEDVF